MDKISLKKMSKLIKEHWSPLDLFRVNDTAVRLVKIKGRYHWHKHSQEDELFLVLKGKISIHFEDGKIDLEKGEGYVVKRGRMHQTFAPKEALLLMVEPASTVKEGD